jgi:hypothetical protein
VVKVFVVGVDDYFRVRKRVAQVTGPADVVEVSVSECHGLERKAAGPDKFHSFIRRRSRIDTYRCARVRARNHPRILLKGR